MHIQIEYFFGLKVIAITLCSNIIFNKTFTTIVAYNGEFHVIYRTSISYKEGEIHMHRII